MVGRGERGAGKSLGKAKEMAISRSAFEEKSTKLAWAETELIDNQLSCINGYCRGGRNENIPF